MIGDTGPTGPAYEPGRQDCIPKRADEVNIRDLVWSNQEQRYHYIHTIHIDNKGQFTILLYGNYGVITVGPLSPEWIVDTTERIPE